MNTKTLLWLLLPAMLQLAGCAPSTTTTDRHTLQPAFDPGRFHGGDVYEILPQASEIRILVYRGGPLARLGHNHVISTRDIHGKIYRHQDSRNSGVVLQLPVNSFEVDNPVLRARAGPAFATTPSAKDIAGTRYNMLGEQVLNSKQYPYIRLVSVEISGNGELQNALMRVSVRDVVADLNIPFKTHYKGGKIIIEGQTEVSQTDLGIKPFSILMGSIAVQDEMTLQFRLVAAANG